MLTASDIQHLLEQHERMPHRAHQLEGVLKLCEPDRTFFGLFDEVGAGKTKQVVDSAQLLFLHGLVDTAVVVAPGYGRGTWADPDPVLGEVAAHCWTQVPNVITEYHKHSGPLDFSQAALHWVVTNYEFIRREARLKPLIKSLKHRKVWLILDESWMVKGRSSDQMRACKKLRDHRADRVVELNGTPLADGKPTDLYAQMRILSDSILGVRNFTEFRSKYCIVSGKGDRKWEQNRITGYQNLDDLNARIAPHVLSRRTRDCFDLPPMLPPLLLEAPLDPPNWTIYRQMSKDLVAWIGAQASLAPQAITRGMRLAQVTSGFLGGFEDMSAVLNSGAAPGDPWGMRPGWLPGVGPPAQVGPHQPVHELGREKLDALLAWLQGLPGLPGKLLVWCRFTRELERTGKALAALYPQVHYLKGRQPEDERDTTKRLLAPGGDPASCAVVANQKAGGATLNFSAASIMVYMSNGLSLLERTQSIGRVERPGQQSPMQVVDIVATGPRGQRTIDHRIIKSLRAKEDMAAWTMNQWRAWAKEAA